MKAILPILVLAALAPAAQAEQLTYELTARVTGVFSLGGTTDAQTHFQSGNTMTMLLTYETDTSAAGSNIFDAWYEGAIVDFSVEYSTGYVFESSVGEMIMTDDHPNWDQFRWNVQDNRGDITAPLIGNAKLVNASAALTDTTRTALTGKALIPIPPFSAFSSGFLNLSFIRADGVPGVATFVNGRILSVDQVITKPTYSCTGFRDPMDLHPVTIKKFSRALPLKASLHDADGNTIDASSVVAKPVVMVQYVPTSGGNPIDVTSETYFVGQGSAGDAFVFEDGEWKYNLKGGTVSTPGTYLIRMVSPDTDEYIIDPECVTSVATKQ